MGRMNYAQFTSTVFAFCWPTRSSSSTENGILSLITTSSTSWCRVESRSLPSIMLPKRQAGLCLEARKRDSIPKRRECFAREKKERETNCTQIKAAETNEQKKKKSKKIEEYRF